MSRFKLLLLCAGLVSGGFFLGRAAPVASPARAQVMEARSPSRPPIIYTSSSDGKTLYVWQVGQYQGGATHAAYIGPKFLFQSQAR